ncbi:30S ribosomal protein S16 [Arsenicibacter rosenii]|uniref:Small ribosomal subunit protein bS16 n=1 Tax=Arsenicibacter rosenii TaxID=1750698 RepID=A0A1S2VMD8_9BACT|nr:30S ribosomal protein S16 [Arsenicibacter rosenii]OIN59932.1 30S ribosomal protein S16 [Arsenicibacter rosenii]
MAVKIRLARRGRKKRAMYDIVVAPSAAGRDGKFLEKLGTYNPNTDPSTIVLKSDRAVYWLMVGAQPTDTARSILSHEGVLLRKHLQVGVNKGAITQEQADEKFSAWKQSKDGQVAGAAESKQQSEAKARQERLDAERKVSADRAAALAKKNVVVEEAPAAAGETTEESAESAE